MSERTRFLLLLFYSALVNTSFMGGRVDVPLLALNLGASTFAVGVLMGLFSLLPAFLSVHTGRWIDHVGLGIPMIACALAMAVCLLIEFFFPSLMTLFLVTPLFGLAFIGFNLAVNAAVGGFGKPEDRTANFSWLALSGGVANAAGPVVTGYLIDALGHATAFAVLAVAPAFVAAVILALRYTRAPRPPTPRPPSKDKVFDLLRYPQVVGPLVIGAVVSLSYDVYAFLIPIYGTTIGLSAVAIGNIMGAFGLAVFLVRLVVPLLTSKFTPWQLVYFGFLLSCAVFLLFPFASATAFLGALSFVYGMGFGMLQPVTTALLFNASPRGRAGEAMGLRATVQNGVHAVMPAFFGAVGALLGTLPVFWSVGMLMAASGWLSRSRWSKV